MNLRAFLLGAVLEARPPSLSPLAIWSGPFVRRRLDAGGFTWGPPTDRRTVTFFFRANVRCGSPPLFSTGPSLP